MLPYLSRMRGGPQAGNLGVMDGSAPISAASVARTARRTNTQMVPTPVTGEPGLFVVDATWGTVAPIELAPGVLTVGELEIVGHIRSGGTLVDTRLPHFHRAGTIPGARAIPHEEILDQVDTLDPDRPAVFFCNGPQCTATPRAIDDLLAAGFPARAILYYRGGMRDWTTLGYPVVPGSP